MAHQEPTWQFGPLNGGQEYLTNSGGHNFRNDPIGKMVREVIQNSLDARIADINAPVTVTFSLDTIDGNFIGLDFLKPHIMSCLERTRSDDSAKRFQPAYERAAEAAATNEVQCLSIIDTNTHGLNGNSWNALIRQEGAVIKNTTAPGGTFGVGKNAPFNLSDLNTVFYSTWFLTRRGKHEQMEGKSLLIPHHAPGTVSAQRQMLQHAGFYRSLDGKPIEGRQIPDCLRLGQSGTGVYIMGFNPDDRDWKTEAIRAVLHNFSYAVHHSRLVVVITSRLDSHQVTISNQNMEEMFARYTESDDKHRSYYLAIRQPPTQSTDEHKPVGKLNVWVLNQGGPRRTAYLNRNGMLITDIPNDTKRNPLSPRNKAIWPDYTAVAMAAEDATDLYIRNMENPSHDEISTEWLGSELERSKAVKAFEHIRRDIAAIIERTTGAATYGETTNAEEMSQYAPETQYDEDNGVGRVLNHRQITMRKRQASATTVETEADQAIRLLVDDEGNVDIQPVSRQPEDEREGTASGGASKPKSRTGRDDTDGPLQGQPIRPMRLQTRVIVGETPDTVIIMLTAPGEGNEKIPVKLRLLPAGAEADREEPVKLLDATAMGPIGFKVHCDGTHVAFDAVANQRVAVQVRADRSLNRNAFRIAA